MRLTPIVLLMLAAPTAASAQVFPEDAAYLPLRCDNANMTDLFADESGALNERDIVGDAAGPAGLRASDATFLYMRLRLEEDPAPAGAVRPFSWGMEFDLDNDATDYELLVLVDGTGGATGTVQLFRNTTTTLPNDPNDPSDQPAANTYTFASNARSVTAAGSTFGASPDFFLDFAIPWADLIPLGLARETVTQVWAATSSSANSLNGDFACHDGAGAAPTLDESVSDPTTGDPNEDPIAPGDTRLEGGGGCMAGGDASPLVLALFAFVRPRKRRRA